jgi:uncharacterized protein involved in exopolysaccharide biosynthesis
MWTLVAGVITGIVVWDRPLLYTASTTFIPHGSQDESSSLANLAGQFGVSVPSLTSSQGGLSVTTSLGFYPTLLRSSVLLQEIATDTFTVSELDGKRVSFLELFEFTEGSEISRIEGAMSALEEVVYVTSEGDRGSEVVRLTATTLWPSVSLAIVSRLLNLMSDFNLSTARSKAISEREFIEERLQATRKDLQESEADMERFLLDNRQFSRSPALEFEQNRLQRAITLHGGILEMLTSSYEELRIREVRDTPVYTIFEPPYVPTDPNSRGRLASGILGLMVGAFFGLMMVLTPVLVKQSRDRGAPDFEEFISVLGEMRREVLKFVPWTFGRKNS